MWVVQKVMIGRSINLCGCLGPIQTFCTTCMEVVLYQLAFTDDELFLLLFSQQSDLSL